MAALVGQTQLRAPSILQSMQTGGLIRGETQRQERVKQSDINKMRLQMLAEEKAARDLATAQMAAGLAPDRGIIQQQAEQFGPVEAPIEGPVVDQEFTGTEAPVLATNKLGNPGISESQEDAQRRLIIENPDMAKKILDNVGIHSQQQYEDASKFAHNVRGEVTPEGKVKRITDRIAKLVEQGRDASDTTALLNPADPTQLNPNLTPEQLDSAMVNLDETALTAWERAQLREKEAALVGRERISRRGVAGKRFEKEQKLRKEYTQASKTYIGTRDAFARTQASIQDPSPAGDISLIFNYMKILDPTSTVREGEAATVQAAGDVPDRVFNLYNTLVKGEKLTDTQRADFGGRAGKLFSKQRTQHTKRRKEYSRIAKDAKLNVKNIVIDLSDPESVKEALEFGERVKEKEDKPKGKEYVYDPATGVLK